ncbi:uncharacterized protein UHOR_14123 [Ustilago hordei]|uniref:Uncharacterized protein n=1 Tax=Ustilago hordei TaxID=120017 RepID=I2FSU6_USTHO|nr:hypothetical protein NDA15_005284 [Ustilago hordei]KAJ1589735.1 hypothetical protein NDA12_000388 [Ustilago hordei]CCF49989.1 uncharacterized protein UHOR_14123 [Ustilago hordei]
MGADCTDISAGQDGGSIVFATLMKQGAESMMNSEPEDGRCESNQIDEFCRNMDLPIGVSRTSNIMLATEDLTGIGLGEASIADRAREQQ